MTLIISQIRIPRTMKYHGLHMVTQLASGWDKCGTLWESGHGFVEVGGHLILHWAHRPLPAQLLISHCVLASQEQRGTMMMPRPTTGFLSREERTRLGISGTYLQPYLFLL